LKKHGLFVTLVMLNAVPLLAQGGAIAAPSSQPAAGVIGSSSPAPSRGRSSRPSPSTTRPPFAGMFPLREANPRAPRGVRPLWFGLVTFDRTWSWTPTVVGGAFDDPRISTPESGLSGGLQLDIDPRRGLVYVDGWYVGVVDHPFFAVTGADGSFELKGLPPGTYTIEAVHEKLGTQTQSVTLAAKGAQSVSFSFKI